MFTLENPAPCVVLNSIEHNPDRGDERNFVRTKLATNQSAGGWGDLLEVQHGDHVLVSLHDENSAAENFEDSMTSWAQGVRARVGGTEGRTYTGHIWGTLSAGNAITIWDGVTIKSREIFELRPIEGSALLFTNATGGEPIEVDVETLTGDNGTLVGYGRLDGVVCPGYQYDGILSVSYEVVDPTP